MADDLDPAAVERAARALWEDARQEYDYAWEPNAESYRDLARKVLAAARAGEPAAPTVTAGQDAAQVLTAHRPVGWARDGRVLCAHHDPDADERLPWLTPDEHAQHQADMLAAAGLLMTPKAVAAVVNSIGYVADIPLLAEHDAQVAARALREARTAIRAELDATPLLAGLIGINGGAQAMRDFYDESLTEQADRIERQEEDR